MPTWSSCAIQNTDPMSANENGKATPPAEENARLRKYASGIIGTGAGRSQSTKHAIRTAPAVSAPITSPLPQPTDGARTGAQTRASSPALISGRPTRSRRGRGPRLSVSRNADAMAAATPTGTLIQKIHCQEMPWIIAPPSSGAVATPRPVMPPQIPMAVPRFSSGNASLISVSDSGSTMAAPAPCTERAAISAPALPAVAHATDDAVNRTRPAT